MMLKNTTIQAAGEETVNFMLTENDKHNNDLDRFAFVYEQIGTF